MHTVYEHYPEKMRRNIEFMHYVTHARANCILTNRFFKTTNSKWPDQTYGYFHSFHQILMKYWTLWSERGKKLSY